MQEFADFLLVLLSQFAGGPGPIENNLVRFGLPAILWGILWAIAWFRQQERKEPRERMLLWGFGLGFAREFYMFLHMSTRIITGVGRATLCSYSEPVEHALGMAAIVVIAASFLRYLLDADRLSHRYLLIGLGVTGIGLLITTWWWTRFLTLNPAVRFHQTWAGWYFHGAASLFLMIAFGILAHRRAWLSNVITLALIFLFLGEVIILLNFGTDRTHRQILCPLANTCHILAIPLFGYVYLREMTAARKRAEQDLAAYQVHLEELIAARTEALTRSNAQLQEEIQERVKAEQALQQISQRNRLILEAAGEGILGINREGEHIFVNPAAARMLGYTPEELIGQLSHATWHYASQDGRFYPRADCPIHAGYRDGVVCRGEGEVFWRKDGTCFPVAYVTTPIHNNGGIDGAVVVFQDITARKQAEAEIQRKNAQLATQNAVTATLNQSLDLDPLLHNVLETLMGNVAASIGAILLRDATTGQFRQEVCLGSDTAAPLQDLLSHPDLADALLEKVTASPSLSIVDEDAHDILARGPLHTLVSVPLTSKSQAVGALILGHPHKKTLSPQEKGVLTGLGQQIGIAIENARLYQKTQQSAIKLTRLHEVSFSLHATLEPTTVYEIITEQAAQLLDCPMACLFRWESESLTNCHPIVYGDGGRIAPADLCLHKEDSPLLDRLLAQRRTIAIPNTDAEIPIPPALRELGTQALLGLPLGRQAELSGILFLIDTSGPRNWRPDEIAWAESFVNHAAIALENAQLHRAVERAAMLEERQRIAAAMHDGVAQTLSYMGLQCDTLLELEKAGEYTALAERFQALRQALNRAMTEARQAIASLNQPAPARETLQEQIGALVRRFEIEGELAHPIVFEGAGKLSVEPPPEVSEQIVKVVGEALVNAQKYAEAAQVNVKLTQHGEAVTVTVEDDGVGFDMTAPRQDKRGHFGLNIMRARAARIEGKLQIHSKPGEGTRITLTWPRQHDVEKPCGDTVTTLQRTKGWDDGQDTRTARGRPRALP